VRREGQLSNPASPVWISHFPNIAAVTDASYNVRDALHAAHPGDRLILWAIGLGATNPAVPDGTAAPSDPPAAATVTPLVQIGSGAPIAPAFAGRSRGTVGLTRST